MTMSAPSLGAFSSMRTLEPGTASSERWRRERVGLMPGAGSGLSAGANAGAQHIWMNLFNT